MIKKTKTSNSPIKTSEETMVPEGSDGLIRRLAVAEKEGAQATWQAMAYNTLLVLDPIYNISRTAFACGEYFVKNDQKSFTDASGLSKIRDEGRMA